MERAPKHPVPIFPLPGVVLFPRSLLSLRVFERRYRALVRDALSGERLIGVALLKPGWERDYQGSPEYFPLGCLARVEDAEWLPDDCYNITVVGLSRVLFERPERQFPYRAARVRELPQAPITDDDPLIELERRALVEAFERAVRRARPGAAARPVAAQGTAFESLVNAVCMAVAAAPDEKLALLELDSILERSHSVRRLLEDRQRSPRRGEPGGESN